MRISVPKWFYDLQIVTVQELIEQDRRIDLPLSFDAVRRGVRGNSDSGQLGLGIG